MKDPSPTSNSPDSPSAGFYMENLLLYAQQAKQDSTLPLPIGEGHKFAPVALGVSYHLLSLTWIRAHAF
jgi:hypothetical protein